MKKLTSLILLLCIGYSSFAQSYQPELNKLNDYLKTLDNGYYGHIEIKDGVLYDWFRDGKNYCKANMADIKDAYELSNNRSVDLACKGTNLCVYSSFVKSNFSSFTFSQNSDFNTSELITLLNNLIQAYNYSQNTTTQSATSQNSQPSESVKELLEFQKFANEVRKATEEKNYYSSTPNAQEMVTLTFKYRYKFSSKYYAMNTKIMIFNNGKTLGESVAKMEYEGNQVSITIPKGVKSIYAKVYAYRDGNWEPYTASFKYPINSSCSIEKDWQQNEIFDLYFDLDNQYVSINNKDYPCPGYYEEIYYDEDGEEYRIGHDEEHDVIIDPYRYTPIYGK